MSRWKTPEERLISSLKDPKAGIRDHLSFLRSVKRELKRQPHKTIGAKRLEQGPKNTKRNGQTKKCNKEDKKT